ncbi:MAG: hypothetical protein HY784_02005, partial [Chloroflexi bacterium]|nr:hypothetical protein [Chloroflexota bacterium]
MNRPHAARFTFHVWRWLALGLLLLVACGFLTAAVYRIPWVYERLFWRIEVARGRVRDLISPPDQTLPAPDP